MIYFIQCVCPGDRPIKIGRTVFISQRLIQLRTGNPWPLTVLGVMESDYEEAEEDALHERFATTRMSGEWFEPSKELLQFIKENAEAPSPDDVAAGGYARVRFNKEGFDLMHAISRHLGLSSLAVLHNAVKEYHARVMQEAKK